jgi:hypothetical protein
VLIFVRVQGKAEKHRAEEFCTANAALFMMIEMAGYADVKLKREKNLLNTCVVFTLSMRFQTSNPFASHNGIMRNARRQIKPVAGIQQNSIPGVRQTECDRSFHNVNHFMKGM